MRSKAWIGFDRRIELGWLDYAAGLAAAGRDATEIQDELLAFLQSLSFDPKETGSARAKTVRVILRMWGRPEEKLARLHADCARLIPTADADERLALHWTMAIAAYPFFAAHAELLGRLLLLQGEVSTPQIRRRIREDWGDRSTVERTSRHVLRSMEAWGVIEDGAKGVYTLGSRPRPISQAASLCLAQGLMLTTEREYLPMERVTSHPGVFAFGLTIGLPELRRDPRFRIGQEQGHQMVGITG